MGEQARTGCWLAGLVTAIIFLFVYVVIDMFADTRDNVPHSRSPTSRRTA